ncbi:MAG: ATP-binding cassette domain-containing protein [Pseudomonadota bacterium]
MGLALSVQDLRVNTASGRQLLSVPEFGVAAGEAVVIKGPSGAGKSTFLYALAGLMGRVEGSVTWGQRNLNQMSPKMRTTFRRETIGFVFQDHHLFEELSALGNAALPSAYAPRAQRSNIRVHAAEMLDRLNMTGQFAQPASKQSGGERQRVAVARALANNPPVILADEPTASLDRAAADALIEDLLRMTHDDGRTLIVVSHDTAFQDAAPRLIEIRDGHLAKGGAHA